MPTSYFGATALAVSSQPEEEADFVPTRARVPEQPQLFQVPNGPSHKVIPFENLQRHATGRLSPLESAVATNDATLRKTAATTRAPQKRQAVPDGQGRLDFRDDVAQGERILTTGVPAQVYGDGRVAPPMRRVTAGAMDVSMVLLGFGLFALVARFVGPISGAASGAGFGTGKAFWITLSLSIFLISVFYGVLWALARRETAGMNWTQLRLVTFDGGPLDGRDRVIRFVSAWLSYCSGGLGLLWALVDEESLAFHDHISKTYPAEKRAARPFVRQRS